MRPRTMFVAMVFALLAPSASAGEAVLQLPARSDLAQMAPASFRAVFSLEAEGRVTEVELWREGTRRSLIRFLAPADAGKFLVRDGATTWFIAPGARKPVKLGSAMKLHGSAALDLVSSTDYGRDYKVTSHESNEGVLTYALQRIPSAKGPGAARVLYSVDAVTLLPIRIESRLPSGKVSHVLSFSNWSAQPGPVMPQAMLFEDRLRAGLLTRLTTVEMEARDVPPGLFDAQDGASRARLLQGGQP